MVADSVVPYDTSWPLQFAALRDRLTSALCNVEHRVEHVGSTAVPGLCAKPVIDVDVVVPTAAWVSRATAALCRARYRHQGDLGIAGRQAFENPPDWPYHHLYLVVSDSIAHRDHIDFRDHLRGHPEDAKRYGNVKYELAVHLAANRKRYTEGKRGLIQEILQQARQRTAAMDLSGDDRQITFVAEHPPVAGEAVVSLIALAAGGGQQRVRDALQLYFDDPTAKLLSAVIDHETVGVVGYRVGTSEVTLLHIAITPHVRRTGVGSQLLAAVDRDRPSALPIVGETDEDAVSFYAANGYVVTSLGEKYPGVERFRVRLEAYPYLASRRALDS
ncbi:hypothetical protein MHEL_22560 [Mycolicibacterium helvum]|uniref:N-acetyltransferase domain-containing protein n=2 Tax=Mycolicibacterium helvum TaxID=1534349 RepID=A0A7I7T5B9_9MYCO|nr:hypothetical protein MHEL_22560 [Mycolicibacterium helvum]